MSLCQYCADDPCRYYSSSIYCRSKQLVLSCMHFVTCGLAVSRLTVVSRKVKELVPRNSLSTNVREFTRTNLVKIKNSLTDRS